ncbi:hypothetical protein FKM82_008636 [Ascaphus truei]
MRRVIYCACVRIQLAFIKLYYSVFAISSIHMLKLNYKHSWKTEEKLRSLFTDPFSTCSIKIIFCEFQIFGMGYTFISQLALWGLFCKGI